MNSKKHMHVKILNTKAILTTCVRSTTGMHLLMLIQLCNSTSDLLISFEHVCCFCSLSVFKHDLKRSESFCVYMVLCMCV